MKIFKFILSLCIFLCFNCTASQKNNKKESGKSKVIKTGAEQINNYLPLLENKSVAVVANQTSLIGHKHLVDSLLTLSVDLKKIFCPEHGFRGDASAGAKIENSTDTKTSIPIISLYGQNRKPLQKDLADIDVIVFDIQDVGVRFYTYISTLHYVMEACAEANIPFIVLDRPNPNAFYVDGPVLEKEFVSFVGMHPVPVVYGMTIGEYAQMINGEYWLSDSLQCDLTVVPLQNWDHADTSYVLPVKPSPNLPNITAIHLYPSLCFFEGTAISVGRGTELPFQIFGHPELQNGDFSFTPKSIPGAAKYPKLEGKKCRGFDVSNSVSDILIEPRLNLQFLINTYHDFPEKSHFFNPFFYKLSGTKALRKQIEAGMNEEIIRKSWEKDIEAFLKVREGYLLY